MKFWIIIRGRNCEKYLDKCLNSVKRQTYKDYHVILILDNPEDRSIEVAMNYKWGKDEIPMTIHQNASRMGLGHNIWLGITLCKAKDKDVICFLDADDYLHKSALATVKSAYKWNKKCLLTFGSYIKLSKGRKTRVSKRELVGKVRSRPWATSHFKTAKYSLIKQMPQSALQDRDGEWCPAASDRGLMYALVEMAGNDRCKHIKKGIYFWNDNTPYKTNEKLQIKWTKIFKKKNALKRVL